MNILSLSRGEVVAFVDSGIIRPENIRHYDICQELSNGKTHNEIADKFNISDVSLIKYIKSRKCPDCNR
jgi:hypothetical protein